MFDVPALFPLYFEFHEGKDSFVLFIVIISST